MCRLGAPSPSCLLPGDTLGVVEFGLELRQRLLGEFPEVAVAAILRIGADLGDRFELSRELRTGVGAVELAALQSAELIEYVGMARPAAARHRRVAYSRFAAGLGQQTGHFLAFDEDAVGVAADGLIA